jgi:hypothetical protein
MARLISSGSTSPTQTLIGVGPKGKAKMIGSRNDWCKWHANFDPTFSSTTAPDGERLQKNADVLTLEMPIQHPDVPVPVVELFLKDS